MQTCKKETARGARCPIRSLTSVTRWRHTMCHSWRPHSVSCHPFLSRPATKLALKGPFLLTPLSGSPRKTTSQALLGSLYQQIPWTKLVITVRAPQGLDTQKRCLTLLLQDLLPSIHHQYPGPAMLLLMWNDEEIGHLYFKKWRQKFALSLNSSWSSFLWQYLDFLMFKTALFFKSSELLPLVLCYGALYTCSGTCKLLIYVEYLLQCSAL